jgi:hypothetical protein
MNNQKSPHILSSSANLLGFSFLILTSVKSLGLSQHGVVDRITGVCVILFALSSFTSFVAIRSKSVAKSNRYENIADSIFFLGLGLCTVLSVLLVLDIVKL